MLAAHRAVRIAADLDVAELTRERIEEEQPSDEWIPDPKRELQRFARLQRADHARQHAEDPAFRARRRELRRRRGGEEAAVARSLTGLEHRHLSLEAVDRAVHDRDVV